MSKQCVGFFNANEERERDRGGKKETEREGEREIERMTDTEKYGKEKRIEEPDKIQQMKSKKYKKK